MATESQLSAEQLVLPNADRIGELIDSEPDPVVQSLLRLVYGEFMMSMVRGNFPESGFDLLYCFQRLQTAFRRRDALENAMRGVYGDPEADLEWT